MIKNKLFRTLGAICVLAMLAGSLAACGGGAGGGGGGGTTTTAAGGSNESGGYTEGAYTLPIVKEPLEISFLSRDCEEPGTTFLSGKSLVWNKFEEETGIKIKWDVIPMEDYWTQMPIRLANASDLPDMLTIVGESDGTTLVKYFNEGVIMDLKPLIDKYAPNIKKFMDDNPAYKDAVSLPGGEIVCMTGATLSKYASAQTYIRQDWLDKLGLQVPTTLEEVHQTVKAFMQDDPNGNGQADEVGIMGADYTTFRQLGVCYGLTMITGGGWGSIDGKVYSNWTSDAYRQLLINLHDMYVDGVMPKDFDRAQFDDKPEYAARDTDRLGFIIRGWTSQLTDYYNPDHTFKKAVPNGEWVPVIWAKTEYGDPHPPIEDVASLWRVISLSTSCKDQVAAIRFIDYTFAGEGRNLNRLGIEGINYNIVNGKVVKDAAYRDKLKDGEFTAELYMPSFSYTEEDAPDKDVLLETFKGDQATVDKVMKLYEKAISQVKPVFQRPIPTADDGKKLADLAADHKTYRDEMYSKFINGSLDIKDDSAWKAYTDQMKALGDDQMREIFQKGVDAKK